MEIPKRELFLIDSVYNYKVAGLMAEELFIKVLIGFRFLKELSNS